MKRNRKRVIAAVAVICALAAGGAAYTNTVTGAGTTNNTAGYAAVSVQGATLADASYSFDTTGANITGVALTFTGDLTGQDVEASFGSGALVDCGVVVSGDVSGGNTTKNCTITSATGSALTLNVLVHNP
jgi:hypothetical protein